MMTREQALEILEKGPPTKEQILQFPASVVWTYGWGKDARFKTMWERAGLLCPKGFYYQYDIEVFFFLYYEEFPTPLKRSEHLWRAAEIRWPTEMEDGKPKGAFIRNPWAEEVFDAVAEGSYVNLMGGSGQGKTRGFMAFQCIIFDYFIKTTEGARCITSSVTEDKLRGAAWSHLVSLYLETEKGISAVAGIGKILTLQIRRPAPYQFDDKGTMQGILLAGGNQSDGGKKQVDKLTGMHVSTAVVILIDEVQSTPLAPIDASYNLATHPKFFWLCLAGNPSDPKDSLGKRYEPIEGWDSVDPFKHDRPRTKWKSIDDSGRQAITIRFDNEYSPGVTHPNLYPFLPTLRALQENYPTEESRRTPGYRRFWRGWFIPEYMENTVITFDMLIEGEANKKANIYRETPAKNGISFDSASASVDRSPALHFQLLQERGGQYVLNFVEIHLIAKVTTGDYWKAVMKDMMRLTREWRVPNGHVISDESGNNSSLRALLQAEMNFHSIGLVYNVKASDKFVDKVSRQRGSDVATNQITEAAILLRNLIQYKQVRGLDESFCDNLAKELCTRRLHEKSSGKVVLEPKGYHNAADNAGNSVRSPGFKNRMGFSPDIFDVCCQAAWFAREVWGLYPGINVINEKSIESADKPSKLFGKSVYSRY